MWLIDATAEKLFEYLKDVLYTPEKATLDVDSLPEDFKELGHGLLYFGQCLREQRQLAKALSKGDLSIEHLPTGDNELAAPLKSLHASLRHMTWQSQQVAKGDYQQKLDFLGDFATAFNTMTQQLAERQKALEEEIEQSRKKTEALEQSNNLFEAITEQIDQMIVVIDRHTQVRLFMNRIAEEEMHHKESFSQELWDYFVDRTIALNNGDEQTETEAEFVDGGVPRSFSITSYPIQWYSNSAVAFVAEDVSEQKRRVSQLENYAYKDNLTGVHNRYYGMKLLREWLDEQRSFCIAFVDMDRLKMVNDSFGHAEGDQYIIYVAEQLSQMMDDALVSRLGGDEFMLLLPEEDCSVAEERMEELSRRITLGSRDKGVDYDRGISYGIVRVDADNTLAASELLRAADDKMYQCKKAKKVQRK